MKDLIGTPEILPPLLPEDSSELEFADALQDTLPPVKTVDKDWFAYVDGAWSPLSRATLRPKAQAILPPVIRTARRESTLIDHLEGRLQVSPDIFRGFYRFDNDGAVLINAGNGIVRVRPDSMELLPHNDAQMFTAKTAAQFDANARADLFTRVLSEALPDGEDVALFQLCAGNLLMPDCRHEVAPVSYGEGGAMKSTTHDPLADALGGSLVQRLTLSQVCDPRSYHLPKLKFAAVNMGTELDAVQIDESGIFKCLVSGEPIEARPIYGQPFTMQTSCKLWFLANGLPRFKHGTEAELRRTRFLRFAHKPERKDVTLKSRLVGERNGVFLFMLDGLQRLLTLPEIPLGGAESRAVHERFKVSNDPLGAFVAQFCQFDAESRTTKDELRSTFNGFCETHGLPVEFDVWFFKRLYERYPNLRETQTRRGTERVRCVAGITLKNYEH